MLNADLMNPSDLRIALFSGNYNYVRDGANRALNMLVDFLIGEGVTVRIYSPTVENPAFEAQSEIVSLPSIPIPGRGEYHFPYRISSAVKRDLAAFDPHILHISSPDPAAEAAVNWARKHDVPVLASVHTAFETYLRYYHLDFLKPLAVWKMRRFYQKCDMLVAPSESFVDILREQRMNDHIGLWTRGVDHDLFNPGRRDPEWRRSVGFADDDVVVGFLGRFVLEKGLDVFIEAVEELKSRGIAHKVMAIGDGPAASILKDHLPETLFTGFLTEENLARAVAAMDVLFNPSVTETFGNVTLEAMACAVPVVAARAPGSASLVEDAVTGRLADPRDISAYADALAEYVRSPELRSAHGAAGAAKALTHSWDEINRTVLDRYMTLAER